MIEDNDICYWCLKECVRVGFYKDGRPIFKCQNCNGKVEEKYGKVEVKEIKMTDDMEEFIICNDGSSPKEAYAIGWETGDNHEDVSESKDIYTKSIESKIRGFTVQTSIYPRDGECVITLYYKERIIWQFEKKISMKDGLRLHRKIANDIANWELEDD